MNAPLRLPAIAEILAHEDEMVAIRHQIHSNPELAYQEHATADLVAGRLTRWGYEVHRGLGGTGVVGTLRCGSSGRHVGLRADMDALPIQETSGKPWASRSTSSCVWIPCSTGAGASSYWPECLGTVPRHAPTSGRSA